MPDGSCLVCGSAGPFTPWFERDGYPLVRCATCRLLFQHPQPSEEVLAGAYYADADFSRALLEELRPITLANARHKLELLTASGALPPAGSSLLDVGASSGAWLEVAAGVGLDGIGVEVGATTAEAARARGLDIRTGTLDDALAGLGERRFDLVTFWDVLEHLRDPRHELALARDLLAPGGSIAMTFPNADGWYPRLTYRLFARRFGVWEYPELPVHLYDFAPGTARRLLAEAGFEVVGLRTFPTPYGFYRTTTLSGPRTGGGARGRFLRGAFDLLHRLVYPVAARRDRGNSLYVVARLA